MSLELLRPRLVEMGGIKIGTLSETERTSAGGGKYRPPEKLDHFLLTTMQRDSRGMLVQDGDLMRRLLAKYGDEDGRLRQIPITLLSNDLDDVLQAAWCWYPGKRIGARCEDGKTLVKFIDPKSGEAYDTPVTTEWKPEFADMKDRRGAPLFKLHVALSCVVAAEDARWGGVYRFRTTSRISGDQLLGSLQHIQMLTRGQLRGMPLRLIVRPMQVAPQGKPTKVYVVHVELRGADLQQIQQLALDQRRAEALFAHEIETVEAQYRKLLKAPGSLEETDEETEAVAAEFHAPPIETSEPAPPAEPDPLLADVTTTEPPPSMQDEPPADWQPEAADPWGEMTDEERAAKQRSDRGWTADGPHPDDDVAAGDLFGPPSKDPAQRGAGVAKTAQRR